MSQHNTCRVLLVVVLPVLVKWSLSVNASRNLVYKAYDGKAMTARDPIGQPTETATKARCVLECRSHPSCKSVNLGITSAAGFTCTLFDVVANGNQSMLANSDEVTFIELIQTQKEGLHLKQQSDNSSCKTIAAEDEEWIVLQQRFDGSVDFYRGWEDYKKGFGDSQGEFWIGLDKIHNLTQSGCNTLRFDLWDEVEHRYAKYMNVTVSDEASNYRLDYLSYEGTAGDSMAHGKGKAFSTFDKDNDRNSQNCAVKYSGAWWYNSCHHVNLNGLYLNGTNDQHGAGMAWNNFRGLWYSLQRTEMRIHCT